MSISVEIYTYTCYGVWLRYPGIFYINKLVKVKTISSTQIFFNYDTKCNETMTYFIYLFLLKQKTYIFDTKDVNNLT